jgi:hypothetical protein
MMAMMKPAQVARTMVCALALTCVSQPALADVFSLSNTNADGSYAYDAGTNTYTLTGGNTGGNMDIGGSGSTLLSTTAQNSFNYTGSWSYSSVDEPGFDTGGYFLNGTYNFLSSTTGQSGTFSFAVTQGDSYGFYVNTTDNVLGAGVLSFSGPSAAGPGGAAPDVGVGLLAAFAAGLALYATRGRKKPSQTLAFA